MNESWNPEIPLDLQQNFKKEKEQARRSKVISGLCAVS